MKHFSIVLAAILFLRLFIAAQDYNSNSSQSTGMSSSNIPAASEAETKLDEGKNLVLADDTPVKLRFNREVSSADSHVDDTVDFEVVEDIAVKGTLVIPKGELAFGIVTEAQPKRKMARGGKLEIKVEYVRLLDKSKATLRAVKGGKGGGHVGVMTGAIVASGILFFPAAPFFLFMQGKEMTIPKGTEFTAYVNGDVKLDFEKFQQLAAKSAELTSNLASLQMDSNPSNAGIEVDGMLIGNTPSHFQIVEGEHVIAVKKEGFKSWERKMKFNSTNSVYLSVELEKTDAAKSQ